MSATLSIAALLTLKDQFSAPLRAAAQATEALRARMDTLASSSARVSAALRSAAQATSSLGTTAAQIAAVGQAATGFGLESYLRNTIGAEHRLAALGNTANMSAEDLRALDARLAAAARATNQFKADLLTANEVLIAAGLEWRQAVDITPVLGKVATATQAQMGDLANTAYALTSNLQVPVEQMQAAFERLTVAGQSGQFELKDMAASFARIGASMGALKFTGLENVSRLGAALQIARRGAGDASEAANNLQNFLAKLAAPEVQKNFEKFGIDLPQLLKRAREQGLDPFLVTLKAIERATGGDEFKLGELFGDMQVQNFIKPMLLYADDYKRLVGEINAANGVLEGNFGRMMNTTAERWKQFRIQLETQPMPWLDDIISQMSEWLRLMNEYPKATSLIAKGLVGIAVAAIALKGAAVVLGGIGAAIGGIGRLKDWMQVRKGAGGFAGKAGGVIDAISGGVQKVWVVNMPGGGLGGGLPDIGGNGGAGKAGGAARTIGARIRSLIAGVMMQASLAWQSIAAWGGKVWAVIARIGAALAPLASKVWAVVSPIGKLAAAFAAGYAVGTLLSKGIDALLSKLLGVPTSLGSVIYDIVQAVKGVPAQMLAIGGQIIDGLLQGMRQRWAALKEAVSGIASGIADTVRGALGIRSPSRVFAELGGHLMGGLQLGIERASSLPLAAMRTVAVALAAPMAAGAVAMSGGGLSQPPVLAAEPVRLPQPASRAAPAAGMAAAPIQITVNLNGSATPEAAQDVAAAVRREVERALAETARRDALARRAALIDGGLA